ncbi:unnamed protein product [Linum tenue]|uniref:Uncharacterized protein n=1 Tax=Linum tenue TaxID=586396 RepID=A0AAV0JQ35_9ROSI|nr:unnamed protein product [Linum tenue]
MKGEVVRRGYELKEEEKKNNGNSVSQVTRAVVRTVNRATWTLLSPPPSHRIAYSSAGGEELSTVSVRNG